MESWPGQAQYDSDGELLAPSGAREVSMPAASLAEVKKEAVVTMVPVKTTGTAEGRALKRLRSGCTCLCCVGGGGC